MNTPGHPPDIRRGMCWLPYGYVTCGLAKDFWSILKKEWVLMGEFGG